MPQQSGSAMIMKDWPANVPGSAGKLDLEAERTLVRLEALARVMDSAFVIPGTTIRMGLDGVVGLVPVIGDAIAGLVSTYLIWEARRLNVPKVGTSPDARQHHVRYRHRLRARDR